MSVEKLSLRPVSVSTHTPAQSAPVRHRPANATSSPPQPLIDPLTTSVTSAFDNGALLNAVSESLGPEGSSPLPLRWMIPSASHSTLASLTQSTLFSNLGALSRSLGRAYEAAALASTSGRDSTALLAVTSSLSSLLDLCHKIHLAWSATAWSNLASDSDLVCDPPEASTLPWTALKTLLFSVTLVLSFVLVLASPRRGVAPTLLQVGLAEDGLRLMQETYFVASKFGPEGFGAWKGVWVGFVGIVKAQEEEGGAERFLASVEPEVVGEFRPCVVR